MLLSIAWRHLTSKKRQTFLVILGAAAGAMVMIVTLGLTQGLIADIQEKIIETSPFITINGEKLNGKQRLLISEEMNGKFRYPIIITRIRPDEKKEVKPYKEVVSITEDIEGIDAVSPFVFTRGVLSAGILNHTVALRGIIPVQEANIANLENSIIEGSLEELAYTKDGILLGAGLSRKLRATYHEIVRLAGENGQIYQLRVAGIFSTGFGATDDNSAYINLKQAQLITGFGDNVVSGIGIHTENIDNVNEISEEISRLTGYKTETWEEANANLLSVFRRNNNITMFLVIFVFVVSGFGIANVLITIVLQKQKDIAVMKSFGFSRRSVKLIFLMEGLIMGIAGAVTGMFTGYWVTELISLLPVSYGESAVVRGDHIVTVQKFSSFIIVLIFSLITSAAASYFPAKRAADLRPVEILRA